MCEDLRPTYDQIYLGQRWGIGIPLLQRLNFKYGVVPVLEAQRTMHLNDKASVGNPVAYLQGILRARAA